MGAAEKPDKGLPGGAAVKSAKIGLCPGCNKETTRKYRPFCSRRCADLDLYNWLKGHYAIPTDEEDGPLPEDVARH